MRLVLDCNVVIAAARTAGTCRTVLLEAVRNHVIVVSAPILDEDRDVATRPKHAPIREVALDMIAKLESIALLVEPLDPPHPLPDLDDTVYLGTALAGEADALITGNLRDFPESACGRVDIMTPRGFLDRIR